MCSQKMFYYAASTHGSNISFLKMDRKHYDFLRKYYSEQRKTGRGSPSIYYKGSRMQRGSGLGSIIGNIMKSPLVKKGLAYGARAALNTTGDVISNLASGDNFRTAAKKSFTKQRVVQKRKAIKAIKKMVRPKKPQKSYKRRNRRRRATDNFGTLTR